MTGPRILLGVLLATTLLLWMALRGPADADLDRGMDETDAAFGAVDAELAALDGDYQLLRGQGLSLGLRETRDQIVTRLAELRSQRLDIVREPGLDRRQRLPRLRALARSSDEMLALAVALRRECAALVALRLTAQPLVAEARRRRDVLSRQPPADDAARTRADALASALSDIEQRLQVAEQQVRRSLDQGVAMGQGVLADLASLIEQQGALLPPAAPGG